jgi:threonine/homoserine/homoserine lactone efflux protein
MLPDTPLLFAFVLASLVLALTPGPAVQTLCLGSVFVAIACCTDLAYVFTASLVAPRLQRAGGHALWGNRIAGTSFIGLGLVTALGSRPIR